MTTTNTDIASIRKEFPLLQRKRDNGSPFIYLDSAATSLKPNCVIEAITRTLSYHTANVHRSVYQLGDEATELYEGARKTIARFIGAEEHEIIFVRNTTEALNLIARSFPIQNRIITSYTEHHSNLLTWNGEITRLQPLQDGSLDMDALDRELARKDVSVVTLSHCSNVTGIMLNAAEIAQRVHDAGSIFVLDGAQSVPHHKIDVKAIDCDFFAFSGHKICGPTGIGVLYGKAERLAELDWYLRGGQTVDQVHINSVVPKPPPWKFEAGTPPIEAAVGLAAAINFLESIGMDNIQKNQHALVQYALRKIKEKLPQIGILGPADERRIGPVSLQIQGLSPHVIARSLSDGYGICVRSGYHCAQPLHEILDSPPTLRASFYLYNIIEEIDQFVEALKEIISFNEHGTL